MGECAIKHPLVNLGYANRVESDSLLHSCSYTHAHNTSYFEMLLTSVNVPRDTVCCTHTVSIICVQRQMCKGTI